MHLQHMATAQSMPALAPGPPHPPGAPGGNPSAVEHALVPVPPQQEESEQLSLSPSEARLPVELDVTIPLRQFRVRTLLALEPGQLIESQWGNGVDVPLACGDVQLAWSEFEVIDLQLAVRLTRLI
jgi:flagellar motor switch/type III secretory pathway protein FliN